MMDEYIADMENTAGNLYEAGYLKDEENECPIKMFFHTSLKCLITHNRFTGPSLSNDSNYAKLIKYAFCNTVSIDRNHDQMIANLQVSTIVGKSYFVEEDDSRKVVDLDAE